jgi:hypothetical protein
MDRIRFLALTASCFEQADGLRNDLDKARAMMRE